MPWAIRRQLFYVLIVIAVTAFFGFLIIYPYINKTPTCSDGRQNGDETGIDCGGSCMLACTKQVDNVSVLWARTFRVVPGRYNAVAYLENKNENTAIYKIGYRFRFADKNNVYIGKRDGYTYVPPSRKFTVFEPAIDVGNSIPVYTSFEFTEDPVWVKVPGEKVDQLKLDVTDIKLENKTTNPALSAYVKNKSLFRIPEVSIVAILYDKFGNAVSTSHTYLDAMQPEEKAQINFTWREPILDTVVAEEIIPIFNIFSVKLN